MGSAQSVAVLSGHDCWALRGRSDRRRVRLNVREMGPERVSTGPNADERFVDYYAEQSTSEQTRQRIEGVRRMLLRLRAESDCRPSLDSSMWVAVPVPRRWLGRARASGSGNRHLGAPDRTRSQASGGWICRRVPGRQRDELPLEDSSCDVVLVSELLEHLPDWEACVNESLRILRPGGVVYFSTTNRLCPIQQEFKLPLYGWYPAVAKEVLREARRYDASALGAVRQLSGGDWFTFYQFRDYLGARGVERNGPVRRHGAKGLRACARRCWAPFVAPRPCASWGMYLRRTRSSLDSNVRPSRTEKNASELRLLACL